MLKGITIELSQRIMTGTDPFNRPVFEMTFVSVDNVLVSPMNDAEVLETLNLTGKKAVYQLAIPKGDEHEWENQRVRFFGEEWRVIGKPTKGVDAMIPLSWNMKVKVESVGEVKESED